MVAIAGRLLSSACSFQSNDRVLICDAEVVAKSKDAPPTADEIADAVRQRGRQRVPDQIKAELLTELRTIILQR